MASKRAYLRVGLLGLLAWVVATVAPGVGVVQAQPERAPAVVGPNEARAPRLGAQELLVSAKPLVEREPPKRRLRRLTRAELSTEMMLASADVVKQHYAERVGTEIELEVAGKPYVARIERHFHPEGGPVKPWGYHPGVSLFAVR
jgi:hypothetical protein